jgi:monomeric isocitrate dehydrogenase
MRTTVTIDSKLKKALSQAQELTKLSQAHVIRMALSAGLPAVVGRFQAPRPDGYFASDYPMPKERMELEAAMAKVKVPPQR